MMNARLQFKNVFIVRIDFLLIGYFQTTNIRSRNRKVYNYIEKVIKILLTAK